MNEEMEQILNHAIQEGYNRAMELLQLCSRAQVIIQSTQNPSHASLQWLKDFTAYLKIQTGDNNAS
jgi:hypothetical protein|tara:strand:- start:787 stop:984 length:198 start_codon:yes stop_codon:yes gene_type:complete